MTPRRSQNDAHFNERRLASSCGAKSPLTMRRVLANGERQRRASSNSSSNAPITAGRTLDSLKLQATQVCTARSAALHRAQRLCT